MNTRTRCHFIGIATPQNDADKRVTFCREDVIEDADGNLLGRATVQPADLVVPFADIATVSRTITDPVSGAQITISGAGIAAWITAEYESRND